MKILILALLLIFALPVTGRSASLEETYVGRIRIVFSGHEVVVNLFDNPASHDLLSLLPLQVTFNDFAREEKLAYLPRKLEVANSPSPSETLGDFTYFRPWGNLAVFYRGFGRDSQLVVLGRIESGKEELGTMTGEL